MRFSFPHRYDFFEQFKSILSVILRLSYTKRKKDIVKTAYEF